MKNNEAYDTNAPIGIFDSGIGGLTVAKAISDVLPNERFIYFGDTAHLPYGEKSKESIIRYSENITQFLLNKGCKAIVIACNTASAFARFRVKELAGGRIVQNVIDPIAEEVAKNYNGGKVGVIATKGTIESENYPKAIHQFNPAIEVTGLATPLLVPMIEEGFFNDSISQTIIENYLTNPALNNIQQLVLGCTHFPLIEQEIRQIYEAKQQKVFILNSATIVAKSLRHSLLNADLLRKETNKPDYQFYVSDYTKSFEQSTAIFFNERVRLKRV